MGEIRVLLLDGFDHDDVDVALDTGAARRLEDVTTALLTGLAAEVALPADGPATLTVTVPARSLTGTLEVDAGATATVTLTPEGLALVARGEDVGLL